MNFQGKLYKEGMLPVYKNSQVSLWRRIKHPILSLETTDKGLEVTFKHTFETSNDTVFFAFTYPWSYSDNNDFLDYLAERVPPSVYFYRETIAFSKENRKIELVTISSYKGLCETAEKGIQNLFPTDKPRAKRFENKAYVMITARVHPGEIPGSFVLNGILKYLCLSKRTDLNCVNLLDNFVFVIIPMLNPDGVYKGHYRTDPQGLNLNRFYVNPSPIDHPSIYAAKELSISLGKRLYMYIDLHAHASKKGCFIFGNSLDYKNQVETCLFPRLLGLNSRHFDYENCDFSQKNMFAKEKGDEFSKEGSGRVGIYKATGILYSYTLECNYNIGLHGPELNELEEKKSQEIWLNNTKEIDLEDPKTLEFIFGPEVKKTEYLEPTPYTIEAFEDIGKGICVSILDLNELNCEKSKNLKILKMNLAVNVLKKAPFRFEPALRKIMRGLSNPVDFKKSLKEMMGLIEMKRKNSEKNEKNSEKIEKNEGKNASSATNGKKRYSESGDAKKGQMKM